MLILVHEFGHFIVAKKQGIYVEEFGLGIPPRIIGKKIGETIYSLNLLPFGGFVRLKGEDTEEYSDEDLNDPRSFISKTPLQRAAVLLAGVFMNICFGVLLFYLFMFINGFKTSPIPLMFDHEFKFGDVQETNTVIFGFSEESPLKDQMELGEAIVSINGNEVNSVEDVRKQVEGNEDLVVKVRDLTAGDSVRDLAVEPYKNEEGKERLGVYLGTSAEIYYQKPLQKASSGFLHTYNVLTYSINGFGNLIGVSVRERSAEPLSETVSGPIGIYSLVDTIMDYSKGRVFLNLIDLMALISVSLAFLNVLPLPALDGGRILFILIEAVRGKRVNPEFEAKVHRVGLLALLSLLILVSVRDVTRFFG